MQCKRPGRWALGLQEHLRRRLHRRGAVAVVLRVAVAVELLMEVAEHSP